MDNQQPSQVENQIDEFDYFESDNLKRQLLIIQQLQMRKSEIDPDSLQKEIEKQQKKAADGFEGVRKISRKTSDDIIKLIEQMPEEHIHDLLQKIQTLNSRNLNITLKFQADLPIRINAQKLIKKDLTQFSLNEDSSDDQDENKEMSQNALKEKKRKKRESKEKKCSCCGLVVKRHQCKHSTCIKPCNIQGRAIKSKEKKI